MVLNHQLLLEIGCEEIPSRFMSGALEQLKDEAAALLGEYRLNHGHIETWGTPRRLVLLVSEMAMAQTDLVETIKGPPVNRAYDQDGHPTRALQGFLEGRSASLEQVEEEIIKDARYVVLRIEIPGQDTESILPAILPRLIQKLSFPRPMYWQSKEVRFARPIRWLLALYNNKPVSFGYAGIESAPLTYGHRFLAPGPFKIEDVDNFFNCLDQNFVVINQDRRREMICRQLEGKAAEKGGSALVDVNLLEEVVYLVEYPVAVDGYFDQAYLDLPQEVLVTTMQHHQRYFPITEKEGKKLMPYFIGISNNRFHENIRKGYSKVLQARLADARFFFNEDRKRPLEDYVDQLSSVIFLESLGSLDQKRTRLVNLAGKLGEALDLPAEQIEKTRWVAHLCKADLVTAMVKEFTELQGVMGREYARLSGEPEAVALGIFEHYLPRFAGDRIPSAMEGAVVSLADRFDTLAGCFAIGIQPTGSQDPFALRRQAQGAVAILLGMKLDLSLEACIGFALDALRPTLQIDEEKAAKVQSALLDFLKLRIRFALQERGISHDVTEAVLAVPFNALSELLNRACVLEDHLRGPLLDEIIIAYNRVANLAPKTVKGDVNKTILVEEAERELYSSLSNVSNAIQKNDDPVNVLKELQTLKEPVDKFFDHVMVMVEDQNLRDNRLNLLASLKACFNHLADFSKLPAL